MIPPGEKKDLIERIVDITDPTVYNEMHRRTTFEMHHALIAFLQKRDVPNPTQEQLTHV